MEMATSIAGNTVRYLGETSPAQITTLGGATSKLMTSSVVKGVSAGSSYYRNSVHVASSAYGGAVGGGIYIPSLGKRITTVTGVMSKSIQGNGYLDPFTNKIVSSTYGEVLAVDHIFPVSEIVSMDGFKRLTKSQVTDIIQGRVGLGNLQSLPQGLNSSKAASLAWEKYGKVALHPQYIEDLGRTQEVMAGKIAEQIKIYNKLNAAGGGR